MDLQLNQLAKNEMEKLHPPGNQQRERNGKDTVGQQYRRPRATRRSPSWSRRYVLLTDNKKKKAKSNSVGTTEASRSLGTLPIKMQIPSSKWRRSPANASS